MTPEGAAHYLADQMRTDNDLRLVITAAAERAGASDIYTWAEGFPGEAVALAESWQMAAEQTPPGMDRL